MNRVLVDTSVWIDALNGKASHQTQLLQQLIDDEAVVLCPVVVQEILQGIKEDHDFKLVKDNLSGFEILSKDALQAAIGAATLYRSIRKKGITIRKRNDCLIAYYAIHHQVPLLHCDEDFANIAQHSTLEVVT